VARFSVAKIMLKDIWTAYKNYVTFNADDLFSSLVMLFVFFWSGIFSVMAFVFVSVLAGVVLGVFFILGVIVPFLLFLGRLLCGWIGSAKKRAVEVA